MQRCELASTVLQLKAMGIDNIMKFDWLAAPPAETMIRALELLHALGALGEDARWVDCTHFLFPPVILTLTTLRIQFKWFKLAQDRTGWRRLIDLVRT